MHVVRSAAFAGVERYIALTARGLADRGWHVAVVGGDPAAMREAMGSRVRHYAATTTSAAVSRLSRLGRVDIVHAHLTAAEIAATLARPVNRAPLVTTRHIAAARGSSRPVKLLAPLLRRSFAVQIAPSSYVAAATGEPCVVLPHGVVDAAGTPATRERLVVVLQRLEPEKDTNVALRAWAASGLGAAGFRLLVAGRGSQEPVLRDEVDVLGIAGSVEFVGFVGEPRALLARAALVIAPSPIEAFGFAVCEAMAEATPVVAADAGAHPELLGPHGVLFPPGDVEAAAELLRGVALDADQRAAYGASLRDRQRHLFTIEAHLDRLEAIYGDMLHVR